RIHWERTLRVPAGALTRDGRAATDREAGVHDRGPRARGGQGFRGGHQRESVNTARGDTLVSDGGRRGWSGRRPAASAGQPVGNPRWEKRAGAPRRGRPFGREDDRRNSDSAANDEFWPGGAGSLITSRS